MTTMATTRMDETNNDMRINKMTMGLTVFEKCMLVAACCLVVWLCTYRYYYTY